MTDFTESELMIAAAARALKGARTVLVGVGLPNIACNLARRCHVPELELIYESGVLGARPARLPLSIGDPAIVTGAVGVLPMGDLFMLFLQGGRIDAALLGTAQIDRYGNLNTTVIGDYESPRVRLPGSGGACEIAIHARRVVVVTRLTRRTFVERLDFTTSPGHPRDPAGFPANREGPIRVITDKAIFDFEPHSGEMQLVTLHPGCSLDEVRAEVGWDLRVSATLGRTPIPSREELRILREELDPGGFYRGSRQA